jgi:hypothetical protein
MKLTTGIVALVMTAGTLWAQNPATIIQNTKSSLQGAQQQRTAAENSALQGASTPSKPSAATATNKPAPAQLKPAVASQTPAQAPKLTPAKAAPATAKPALVAAKAAPVKTAVKTAPAKVVPPAPVTKIAAKPAAPASPAATAAAAAPAAEPKPAKPEDKKFSMTGKRDPFISPVINRQGGSGCSTGKKCLDIEQIAVRGVVKSDNGMIAVVTNGLNKAYFLRENDPVFNGYVVKITVDSVVFKQNFQDRLGKPFTKDVVKRITTPAV